MSRRLIISIGVVLMLIFGSLGLLAPRTSAQFLFASWDFPDEHGQGLNFINVYENSTGSWVLFPHDTYGNSINSTETASIDNWTVGVSMMFRIGVILNASIVGAEDVTDGRNFIRVSVSVIHGTEIFSQQNATFQSGNDFGLYYYDYDCILNFIPATGSYAVTVTYQVVDYLEEEP